MSRVSRIHYSKSQRSLNLCFDDGTEGSLAAEFLRVHSPSAEVRGHGNDDGQLVAGKAQVAITDIRAVGHYAVQLIFDDGHDSGLYTWGYLRDLLKRQSALWQTYEERLYQAGLSRDPDAQVMTFKP